MCLMHINSKGVKRVPGRLKLTLKGQYGIIYNLKRIHRIMKKYGILCPIRKANPYKRMIKATKEHIILPNLLNRNFKQGIPGKVLLTDITYIFYGNGRKAYLSIATLTGVNLMLLSPDEIEEKANRDGDFLYLRFKEVKIGIFKSSVSLDNAWISSKDSNGVYLSGGGLTLQFYNILGKWIESPFRQRWIS
jgi:hypothetical protein